jgi:ABC-2 type transport system permease protein
MSVATATVPPILRRSRSCELSAMLALYKLTLRQHLHGRRLVVLGLLYLLPCALTLVLRLVPHPARTDHLEIALVLHLLPHALAPLTALLYAAGIIRDEVEEQTLTYLLLRSVPRWAIYVTKLLATVCVSAVLVTVAAMAVFVAIYANSPELWEVLSSRLPRVVVVFALAQLAYCVLFGLMGLITRRSLIAGIAYIALIEGFLANIDFVARSLTIVYYVRTLVIRWVDLPELIMRDVTHDWGLNQDTMPTVTTCLTRLLAFCIIGTLLGGWWFSRREIRMKTPGD